MKNKKKKNKRDNDLTDDHQDDMIRIWTLEMKPTKQLNDKNVQLQNPTTLPLVMLHGFASGIALWAMNLDQLSQHRHVFAIDLPGFARSSRMNNIDKIISLRTKATEKKCCRNNERLLVEARSLEDYMVDCIEHWRQSIGTPLDGRFILLGHSFGGYLATAYSIRYPQRVAHVILADPWGFPSSNGGPTINSDDGDNQQKDPAEKKPNFRIPLWVKLVAPVYMKVLNPLGGLRLAGPWGPSLVERTRPDITKKFEQFFNSKNEKISMLDVSSSMIDDDVTLGADASLNKMIPNYIYHCNAQTPASGEVLFMKLSSMEDGPLLARSPMLDRIGELNRNISLSFIYGSNSWVDSESGHHAKRILERSGITKLEEEEEEDEEEVKSKVEKKRANVLMSEQSNNKTERVKIFMVEQSGHHVYADNPDRFNQFVNDICNEYDRKYLNKRQQEQQRKQFKSTTTVKIDSYITTSI